MRKIVLGGAVAVVVGALALVPLPLAELEPGGALPVAERIELATDTEPPEGRLLLTAVRITEPTAFDVVESWLDEDDDLVRRRRIVPSDVDPDEFRRQQLRVFEESTRVAAAVAQRAAGLDVTVSGDGALVAAILPGTPAAGTLQTGDVIVEVGGTPVELASEVGTAISGATAGEQIELSVERDDERMQVTVELERIGRLGQVGIGVGLQTVNREIRLPADVELTRGGIGGPSAGLMLALTVYDLIDDTSVTGGRTVAGSGTIDTTGTVGPVGGVAQKVESAEQADADLFLVPEQEASAARDAAGSGLEVVPVGSFDDALRALTGGTGAD